MLPHSHSFPHHSLLGFNSNVSSLRTPSLIVWTRQPLQLYLPTCFALLYGNLPTYNGFFNVRSPLYTLSSARERPCSSPSPLWSQHPGLWLQWQHIPVFEAELTNNFLFQFQNNQPAVCPVPLAFIQTCLPSNPQRSLHEVGEGLFRTPVT